jgi:sortase A
MGKRSDRRKFRRRRRWAGFFLLLSLAFVAFGALLVSETSPPDLQSVAFLSADKTTVARAASVRVADAPEAAAGQEADKREAAKDQASKKGAGKPEKESTGIPTPPTDDLWISIPALGLYNVYVTNTSDPREGHAGPETPLDYGLIKLAETGFPWQPNANPYIVGHRLGWPGTGSYHIFYNLPLLAQGDKIYLGDVNGTTYTYRVTGFREITPDETWITAPQPGRDMLSLQTCIENFGDYWTMGPHWYVRYIVQADRVSVDVAK